VKARLHRVADVLDAMIAAHTASKHTAAAVLTVAPLETIRANARELRQSTRKGAARCWPSSNRHIEC
jgi:hypothetical protein